MYRLSLLRLLSSTNDRPGVTHLTCSFNEAAGHGIAQGLLCKQAVPSLNTVNPSPPDARKLFIVTRLARYQIACCAADAAPVVISGVGVHGSVAPLDQWVTVIGRFEPGGGDVPRLFATNVSPIEPPDEPYE